MGQVRQILRATQPARTSGQGARRRRQFARVLPAVLVLGSVVLDAPPAKATFPGVNGRIACWSRQIAPGPTGHWDVLSVNPDGSDPRNLTNQPLADLDPVYTPNGREILFISGRDQDESEVFIMNHDGTNVRQIIDNGPIDDRPFAFSPDGSRAVFQSNRDGNAEIYRMNADGSNQVRLTNNPANDASPDWSPDGTRIAFQSNRTGDTDIYTMNPDGTDVRPVIVLPGADTFPRWSPDGRQLTFARNLGAGNGGTEIFRVNADGTNLTRLTNNNAADAFPVWSPDGTKISWQSTRQDPPGEVYVMNAADGSDVRRLTFRIGLADGICSWQRLGPGGALCTIAGIGNLVGTTGDDVICGSAAADTISGGDGNDAIVAGAGADRISGGPGNDQIHADEGDDQVSGDDGRDELRGGPGNDFLAGDSADAVLSGGGGNDFCFVGPSFVQCSP